jgi:GT2 family glycosyltransferase
MTAVSVVIPLGGFDELAAEQIRAVADQAGPLDAEVVLSLNTPDAGAGRALHAFVEDLGLASVRVVPSHERAGAAHARNAGARASTGAVIAFCDADDLVLPGWLAAIARGCDADDAVGGRLVEDHFPDPDARWRPPATPDGNPTFLGVAYIVSANMAIRRDAFEAVGGFDEDLTRCEDIAISWALLKGGRSIGYVADAEVAYRHRAGLGRMMKQHFMYGRGMSEVLVRYGVPGDEGAATAKLLRPNSQPGAARSLGSVLRRGSLAAGRVSGLALERLARRRRREP